MWWLLVGCTSSQVDEARKHLDTNEGTTWIRSWRRYGLFASMGVSTGSDAPDELGARKSALARCGLRGDDVLSAIVTARDTDVGPWEVEILTSSDPETGVCVARLLESVPWDREHPGSAMVLAFRTTGSKVAAWVPREEEPESICRRDGRMSQMPLFHYTGAMPMGTRWQKAFSCPSDTPLTRLELEFEFGRAEPIRVETVPPVPCVADRVRSELGVLSDELEGMSMFQAGFGPIRCTFDLPLGVP